MEEFTIYCTEEQVKKALELGAPLNSCYHNDDFQNTIKIGSLHYVEIPTAEQMMGWLESKGLCVEPYRTACGYLCTISKVPSGTQIYSQDEEGDDKYSGQFTTKGKAILAAIDAALEYLSNKK